MSADDELFTESEIFQKYIIITLRTHSEKCILVQSLEEDKDQESIQPSTTLDPGHHIVGKVTKRTKTSHSRESRGQPFPCK